METRQEIIKTVLKDFFCVDDEVQVITVEEEDLELLSEAINDAIKKGN